MERGRRHPQSSLLSPCVASGQSLSRFAASGRSRSLADVRDDDKSTTTHFDGSLATLRPQWLERGAAVESTDDRSPLHAEQYTTAYESCDVRIAIRAIETAQRRRRLRGALSARAEQRSGVCQPRLERSRSSSTITRRHDLEAERRSAAAGHRVRRGASGCRCHRRDCTYRQRLPTDDDESATG